MEAFFASLLAVKFNAIIASACIYMGGTIEDIVDIFPDVVRKVPLLFIVGTKDRMLRFTTDAKEIFLKGGYYVEFETVEGAGHVYYSNKEQRIWNFFKGNTLLDTPTSNDVKKKKEKEKEKIVKKSPKHIKKKSKQG